MTGISDYRSIVIAALPFCEPRPQKVTLPERAAEGKADGIISSPKAMSGHEKDTTPAQNRSSSESAKGEAKAGGIDKKLLQEAIGLASTPEMLAALEALKSGTFNADFVKSMVICKRYY